jgi:hypothetical protein
MRLSTMTTAIIAATTATATTTTTGASARPMVAPCPLTLKPQGPERLG